MYNSHYWILYKTFLEDSTNLSALRDYYKCGDCSHETVLTLRLQKYINIGSNSSTTSYIINSRIKYCPSSFLLSNHFLTWERGREDKINPAHSSLSNTHTALCLKAFKVWLSLNLLLPKNTPQQVLQFLVYTGKCTEGRKRNKLNDLLEFISDVLRLLFSSEVNQFNQTPISPVPAGKDSYCETAQNNTEIC